MKTYKVVEENYKNKKQGITKATLIKDLKRQLDLLESDPKSDDASLFECSTKLLDELEFSSLNTFLQICGAKEDLPQVHNYEDLKKVEDFSNYPCNVFYSDKYKATLIDTPVVLGSMRNVSNKTQGQMVASLIAIALKNYELENKIDFSSTVRMPFSVYFIRRCLPNQSSNVVPDTDNVECRKIINAIVKEFDLCDSYSDMISVVSTIEYVASKDDRGTSILVVNENKRLALETYFLRNKRKLDFLRENKKT